MTEKEEEHFGSRNTCWICEKLIDDDEKLVDHCHITRKCKVQLIGVVIKILK